MISLPIDVRSIETLAGGDVKCFALRSPSESNVGGDFGLDVSKLLTIG